MPLRMLIVDDNAHFLAAARDLLNREGMTVVDVASTGTDAMRLAAEQGADVILVDIDLGGESGLDLARSLTAGRHGGQERRVILMSAYPEEEFAELIDENPAVAFIPKSQLSGSAIAEIIGGLAGRDLGGSLARLEEGEDG
jgi:DNA-binding NarL/FixJ family response regulator